MKKIYTTPNLKTYDVQNSTPLADSKFQVNTVETTEENAAKSSFLGSFGDNNDEE